MVANQKNCDAMAAELHLFFDRHEVDMRAKQGFEKRHQAEIEDLMKQMMPAIMACKDSVPVQKALERMQ